MNLAKLRRLLWDVDLATVDDERYRVFIIRRVFDEGTLEEIRAVAGELDRKLVDEWESGGRLRAMTPQGRALLHVVVQ